MFDRFIPSAELGRSWNEFWLTDVMRGTTMNYIEPPSSGLLPFTLLLFLAAFMAFGLYLVIKKELSRPLIVRSSIYSFLFIWLIFALRMDYNWFRVFAGDVAAFSGRSAPERIKELNGDDLYDFMEYVRKILPDGEQVRELAIDPKRSGFITNKLGNYYLLPSTVSRDGRFIWVYNLTASYDPGTGVLKMYDFSFRARPYAVYDEGAAVFEVLEVL